jgi:hypothetical protein
VNTEQVKQSKDMLPNTSRNSGKSGPGGRAMNFRRPEQPSELTLIERVNTEQFKPPKDLLRTSLSATRENLGQSDGHEFPRVQQYVFGWLELFTV